MADGTTARNRRNAMTSSWKNARYSDVKTDALRPGMKTQTITHPVFRHRRLINIQTTSGFLHFVSQCRKDTANIEARTMCNPPMHALTMPMMVPLSVGKFLVQVMRAVVSMKVPARGATMEIPMTCQYEGWIHLHEHPQSKYCAVPLFKCRSAQHDHAAMQVQY